MTFSANRRITELLLLIWVLATAAFAQFQVQTALPQAEPVSTNVYVSLSIAALVGHLAIRWLAPLADPVIYPIAVLLTLLGLVMINRLDIADVIREVEPNRPQAPGQAMWLVVGLVAMIFILWLVKDHRTLSRYTFTAMVVGVLLLLLPMVPFLGATLNGARLWIRVAGYSFQPAEAAKLLLVVFFAGYLARNRNQLNAIRKRWFGIGIPRPRDLGPLLLVWAISLVVLVSQRDLGTSLLFFGLFVGLLYAATGQRTWLAAGGLLFLSGATLAYFLFSHVRLRVLVWLDPFAYAHAEGFQISQALYGVASGGIFGQGLGQGYAWLVPYSKSDFILTAFAEELGYTGLVALLMLYAIVIQRIVRISLIARDDFGRLLALGFALVLTLQIFVVLGGVTRLIPLTGLATPFLAAGGSALLANWVMVGLLLRISHTTATLNLPAGESA